MLGQRARPRQDMKDQTHDQLHRGDDRRTPFSRAEQIEAPANEFGGQKSEKEFLENRVREGRIISHPNLNG